MTKIGEVIQPGQAIPDDVLGFTDHSNDPWRRISDHGDRWEPPGTANFSGGHISRKWAPLTVFAVREPERTVERAGGPQQPTVEPEPDEVVHYRIPGDASPLTLCGLDVWADDTSVTERAGSSNCTACREAACEDKPEAQPACRSCGGTGLVHGSGANGNWTTERCGCDEEPSSEATCHRCGGPNVVWAAPSPLWNVVMRGGSIGGQDQHDGIVCPTCFAVLAEAEDLAGRWRLHAESVTPDLESVTPDGRVWDDKVWLWVDPAEDKPAAPPVLLDLVRQYGSAKEATGGEAASGSTTRALEHAARSDALFDRIAALVPQQPVQAHDNHGDALWIHGCGHVAEINVALEDVGRLIPHRDCPTGVDGPWRPLLVGGDPAPVRDPDLETPEAHAYSRGFTDGRDSMEPGCGHGALIVELLDITDLDEAAHLPAAVQNLVTAHKTARPDPSVLSLPTVPDGAVALIGGRRWVRSERAPEKWKLADGPHPHALAALGAVLDAEGPVTVVMREPRTWPRLDPEFEPDLPGRAKIEGYDGVWFRMGPDDWFQQPGSQPRSLAGLRALGDVTEVFEDEPGGAA